MPTRLSGRSFWKGHISLGEWSSPDHNPWAWGAGTQRPEALGGWGLGKEQMPRERGVRGGQAGKGGRGWGGGSHEGKAQGRPRSPLAPAGLWEGDPDHIRGVWRGNEASSGTSCK